MQTYLITTFLIWLTLCCSTGLAEGPQFDPHQFTDNTITELSENAEREAREIISKELDGLYDITSLKVIQIEKFCRQTGPDYPLAKVTLSFSTTRNSTRSPYFKPSMECKPTKVPNWFYLHCGVPVGYVFDGKVELLLVLFDKNKWRAVSPTWRKLSEYPLDGYLLLEGRLKEGYVFFR